MSRTLPVGPAGALALALLSTPAAAQDLDIGEIVVTPNRAPTDRGKTGAKVDTVTRREIDEQGKPNLVDYLGLLPGVAIASAGGAGKDTSLSLRGADKKYVKTLWNGIDLADPSSTQVQTAFEHLGIGNATGIEVLKGSQSTLYGSDAVAGVIAVSSLGGIDLGTHQQVSFEAGSRGTWRGSWGATIADEQGKAAFNLTGLTTRNGSAAGVNGTNPALDPDPARLEDDPYRNVSANMAFDRALGDGVSVFGAGIVTVAHSDFDDGGYPPRDNAFNQGGLRQFAGRTGFRTESEDGRLRHTFAIQGLDIARTIRTVSGFGPYDADYAGRRAKGEYQGAFDLDERLTLQWGADVTAEASASSDNYGSNTQASATAGGLWAQAIITPIETLTLDAGVRRDHHSSFGGHTTWRLAASWTARPGTRLHASAGTGYRAPSLYELYAPFYGNAALQPEESQSADAGIEQTFLDGRLVGDVTAFLLNTKNLIDYDFATSTYQQTPGVTRRYGVETALRWAATDWLDLTGAYTYTEAHQADGARRPRIPRHAIALTAAARPAERWEVAASARIALDTVDIVSSVPPLQPLDNYVVVDARLAYKPNEATELYLRAENLLNQKYATVWGYPAQGIGVFAGVKAKF